MNRLSAEKQKTIEIEDRHFGERREHEKRHGGTEYKVCSEKTGPLDVTGLERQSESSKGGGLGDEDRKGS